MSAPFLDAADFAAAIARHIRIVTGAPTVAVPSEPALAIDRTSGLIYAWSKDLGAWVVGGGSGMADWMVFSSDTDTGFYRVAANTLGVSAGGVAAGQFTGGGYGAPNGVALTPSISFASDLDTGIYRAGANSIGFSAGGATVAVLDGDGLSLTQQAQTAGPAMPLHIVGGAHTGLAFSAATGIWFDLSNTIQFDATGGPTIGILSALQINPPEYEGSGAPGVTATVVATLYIPNAPVLGPNMTFGDSWSIYVADGACLLDGPVHISDGAVGAPGIVFNDDRNTGLYRSEADTIGFAVNGAVGATLSTTALAINTKYIEVAEIVAPAAPGANGARLYAEDTGGGKTRLVVLFPSGAAQVIATEP